MMLALWLASAAARAEAPVEAFNAALAADDLPAADAAIGALLDSGATTADVYFNLGNLRYRQGRAPEAVLAWRCAEARAPRDPDVAANLDFARRQLGLSGAPARPVPSWAPWQALLTPDEGQWVGASLAGLGWLVFALALVEPLRARAPWARGPAAALGALGVLIGLGGLAQQRQPGVGVVLASAHATSDLGGGSTLFDLAPGAEVRLLDSGGGQLLVGVDDARRGWVPAGAVYAADPALGCRVTDATAKPAG